MVPYSLLSIIQVGTACSVSDKTLHLKKVWTGAASPLLLLHNYLLCTEKVLAQHVLLKTNHKAVKPEGWSTQLSQAFTAWSFSR